MGMRIAGLLVLMACVSVAVAQPAGRDRPARGSESQAADAAPTRPEAPAARPEAAGDARPASKSAAEAPEPTATSRMVLVRFVIAEVTLRGEPTASGKPAAASPRPGGAGPAAAPILAMPAQTLFDADRLNRELQSAPLDLRSGVERIQERLTTLLSDRAVEIVTRGQLVTLDAQGAYVQVGQRVPRITAAQATPHGRVNSYTMASVGMIAAFTPRVADPRRINLKVELQKSQLAPEEEGAVIAELASGEKVRTPSISSMSAQTMIGLVPGQAVALAGVSNGSDPRRTEFVILVSADLLEGK